MYNYISVDGANVMFPSAKTRPDENEAPARGEMQKQQWNDYCCMVDEELRKTEKRVVDGIGPYVAISIIISFVLAVALPLYFVADKWFFV